MKKIIIAFAALLIVIVAYNFFSVTDVATTEEGVEEGFGSKIKKSFNKMIPGKSESENKMGTLDKNDPHVVVINSKPVHIEVDDAVERIESQKDLKDNEAIDFARWTLFSENAKYTPEEKEQILEKSIDILKPSEAAMITRDVLLMGKVPGLVDTAMNYQSQTLKREDFENLVREVLQQRSEPDIRNAVIEFAATKNIYVK